jgi:predicted HicB family RNase H-like nuclease
VDARRKSYCFCIAKSYITVNLYIPKTAMTKESTALLAVRIEKSVKDKAVQRASGLGISLTTAIKGLLADFVGGKPVTF